MSKKIQSIRGMHDLLPGDTPAWRFLEGTVQDLLAGYGYEEIRLPIVEMTELFKRSIGEVTDIVEKEMYTFDDRNGESLTLRPEGTAGCVRAGIEHGLLHNQQQRLWYKGPMFRHERPQKGRYRQFYQIGVETFGIPGPDIDAELILITARLWRRLGLKDLRLEINSLGTAQSRAAYRERLVDYLTSHKDALDEDSLRRLQTNPLRVLDSKNPNMREIIDQAPNLLEYLDEESQAHFERLKLLLDDAGVSYRVNPRLVRGLDYYSRTVFEWITDSLGAQGTVCAGGRYDALVEQLGGRATTAAGFAMGLERLLELIETEGVRPEADKPHAYLAMVGEHTQREGFLLAERLRESLPALRLMLNCGEGGFKPQMKRADRSGARWALILGEDECAAKTITVKHLRDPDIQQKTIPQAELIEFLSVAGL